MSPHPQPPIPVPMDDLSVVLYPVSHVYTVQYKWHFLSSPIKMQSNLSQTVLEASWNVMAHAQKPDFVFRRNGRVHLNRRGASVQSTTGSRVVRISGSNAGYTMFRGSVKGTGYPLHSLVFPTLSLPCVTACHHISTGVYIPVTSSAIQMAPPRLLATGSRQMEGFAEITLLFASAMQVLRVQWHLG